MADGTTGISRANRSSSLASENACVDEEAKRKIDGERAEAARKLADAEAHARASEYYANGAQCGASQSVSGDTCGRGVSASRSVDVTNRAEVTRYLKRLDALEASPGTSPDEHAWLKKQEPALRAAAKRFEEAGRAAEADTKRIDEIVHPSWRFFSNDQVEREIVRLKGIRPAPNDDSLKKALAARLRELTDRYAVGFHHEAPGTESNARIVPGSMTKPNTLGVYEANVDIKDPRTGQWVRKEQVSSFFPKMWTRSEVRTAILEAFARRVDLSNGRWEGRLSNGMLIAGAVDGAGRITMAYPEIQE